MSVIEFLYGKFALLLSGWKVAYFVIFLVAFPAIALVLQEVGVARARRYGKAWRRLKAFVKRNAFISPRNLFFFNKKVVKVFPHRVKRQVNRLVDKGANPQELIEIFKYDENFYKPSVVKAGYFIHIVSMGVIMGINGFALPLIAFCAVGMSVVWIAVGVVDRLISALIDFVDRRKKKKFILALERSVTAVSPEIDLSVPAKSGERKDSVSKLAKSVEDFLAEKPDKGIAGVVLKSLYSASFSPAESDESAKRLKNAMFELKKYVG